MTLFSRDPFPSTAVLIASGGLDSTALAYHLQAGGVRLVLLSFDYGQRHRQELDFAAALAARLGTRHHLVDLRSVGALLCGSALTDMTVAVPDGHYTDESMSITVVPNRNAVMLNVAVAVAVTERAGAVAFGAHAGDRAVYPDCRSEFVELVEACARVGNEGFLPEGFRVLAPFLTWSKAEIVKRGAELDVPFTQTWSCYKEGVHHCGRCGTCTERKEAFELAGVIDPTAYVVG
ncbi:MAG: 7-cyano-7-deazaguanine synthase QueC [Pseudonocardiaceae bacterium]